MSGEFKAGTSTAIIGPSGSGKTTLLNFICARMKESPNLAVNGNLYVNGHKIDSIKDLKHRFGYVMQFDVMYQDFTPKEQFLDTAQLAGVQDPQKSTQDVVEWFNLQKCENTRVGGVFQRGLSGGEKKRTSIGLEVITNPSVIFMDEPTTGLDSKSALDVAKLIKALAENGRTIISTIHQPSTDILARFDRIICLCEGRTIYDGKPLEIPQYFADLGYPPPAHTNPADHVLTIVNDDDIRIRELNKGNQVKEQEVRKEFEERLDHFSQAYETHKPALSNTKCPDSVFEELKVNQNSTSFFLGFCIIIAKLYSYQFRNFKVVATRIFLTVGFAIFNILLYNDIRDPSEDTLGALQDRQGMVFSLTSIMCFSGIFSTANASIPILPAFKRENESRLYHPITYYFISTLYHIPIQIVLVIIYQSMVWFTTEMKTTNESLFKYFSTFVLCYFSASGFGDILAFTIQDIAKINQLIPVVAIPFFMLAGVFAKVRDLVFYLLAYSYLSFFRFGYQAGILIEFGDGEREVYLNTCKIRPPGCFENSCIESVPGNQSCDPFTNNDFIETNFYTNLTYLVAQAVFYRLVAAVIFYMLSLDKKTPYEPLPAQETFEGSDEDLGGSIKGKPSRLLCFCFQNLFYFYLFRF